LFGFLQTRPCRQRWLKENEPTRQNLVPHSLDKKDVSVPMPPVGCLPAGMGMLISGEGRVIATADIGRKK
jgi:hypothetical protein